MEQSYCDALRFAIELEQSGEKFYRESAAKVEDPFAHKVLAFLADEEVEHMRKIEQFNLSLLGQGEFDLNTECRTELPQRVEEFLRRHLSREARKIKRSADIDIYSMAMGIEKASHAMYTAARQTSAGDALLERFFDFLIAEERHHYGFLAASRKYLEDPAYYFEEFGGWIFG